MKKRSAFFVLLLLFCFASLTANRAGAQNDGISLMGARARRDGQNQVRLLWIVTKGWLPPSGVNVYRSDNPTKALNVDASGNVAPIKLEANTLDAASAAVINNPVSAAKPMFGKGIGSRATGELSSKAAFTAYKNEAVRLKAQTGLHSGQIAAQAAKQPEVQSFRARLLPPQAIPVAKGVKAAPLTGDAKILSVRVQVLLTSLTSFEAARHLGMAFIDKTSVPAQEVTYTLKSADTAQTTLATVAVAPDTNEQPAAPLGLDGVQTGQSAVALHWEPVDDDTIKKLVSVSYDVYKNGAKLNTLPIRLAFLPTKGGGHVAAMNSFVDKSAALGQVAYTVKLTDAFGRESAPTPVSVAVSDLRVPGPVNHFAARASEVQKGAVRLFWSVPDPTAGDIAPVVNSSDTDTAVQITRVDASGGEPEKPLAPVGMPLTGDGVSLAPTPTANRIPDELKDMTGSDLFLLAPEYETFLRQGNPAADVPGLSDATINGMRNQTVIQVLAQLSFQQKARFNQTVANFRTTLDTTGTPDKDYQYRIVPCYVINPTRFSTGAQSRVVSVYSAAVPATVAGLQGAFQKGAGQFGYTKMGPQGTPAMRPEGMSDVEKAASRIRLSDPQKAHFSSAAASAAHTMQMPRGNQVKTTYNPDGTIRVTSIGGGNSGGSSQAHSGNSTPAAPPAPKGTPDDADVDGASAVAVAGKTTLTWQPVSFTSKMRYRVYRASATGLFPTVQSASAGGLPPAVQLNTVPKVGMAQRPSIKSVAQKRLSLAVKYFENFPSVPNQNYVLLTETDQTTYADTLPASQRVHYHYRIVPVTRWGIEGAVSQIADVTVPATLPPSLPTLLKTEVDEATTDGRVRLTISANPPIENVQKYWVFRKSVADSAQAALIDRSPMRVASAHARYAPPVPVKQAGSQNLMNPPKIKNLNLSDMKANGAAIFKRILNVIGYSYLGEVTAPATGAVNPAPLTFTDTTGAYGTPYTYMVVAVNTDAISSKPSAPLDASSIKVRSEAPQNLSGSLSQTDPQAAQINLSWQPSPKETPDHYVLERAVQSLSASTQSSGSAPPKNAPIAGQIGSLPNATPPALAGAQNALLNFVTIDNNVSPQTTALPDPNVRSGRKYIYRLRAVDANGLFSDSVQTSVVYPALANAVFHDPAPTNTANNANPTETTTPTGGAALANPMPATKEAFFGGTYFLTNNPTFAVRVDKAAFRAQAYAIDAQNFYYNRPTEKFLQLTLRVKNVSGSPQTFDYQTITATSVTADGAELAATKNWKALDTDKLANRLVAPGAEFIVEGVLTVPADGTPRSLAFGDDEFNLTSGKNNVAPLPTLFGGGDTIAPEFAVTDTKAAWPMAYTEAALAEKGFTTGANNASVYAVSLRVRNVSRQTIQIAPSNFTMQLLDEDGDSYPSDKNDTAPTALAPGAQATLRWTFAAPKTIKFKSLKARERDGRAYLFPIGN